jgi:hypothetical protein
MLYLEGQKPTKKAEYQEGFEFSEGHSSNAGD